MTETEDYDKTTIPALHASSHESGGSDVISIDGLAGVAIAEQLSSWVKVSGKPILYPPGAHAAIHEDGGPDKISIAALSGEAADEQKSAWAKVSGKPATFPPSAHKTSHQNGGSDEISIAALSGEATDEQKSSWAKVSGKPATFPPSTHKTSHQNGGADEISIAALSGEATDEQKSSWAKVSGKPTTFIHSSAVVPANKVIVGDDGARNVKACDIVVSADGEMTNPSQPAFIITNAAIQQNIPVTTPTVVVFDTEIKDQGNNFAENTFTAPITGCYQISVSLRIDNVDVSASQLSATIITSNRIYYCPSNPSVMLNDFSNFSLKLSVLVDMDANDTVYISIYQGAGEALADLWTLSYFTGALIC